MDLTVNGIYQQYILPWGLKIFAALAIFIIGKWVARLISVLAGRAMATAKMSPSLVTFGTHVIYYALWIMVAIAALNKLGVETTSFVALVGAAGLAVGLALQGALSNFAAGVMVLIFQPFGIGDEIEAGGTVGVVKEIQMFNTVFHTADGRMVIVPNAKITADKITINKKA
ncbi:MAG: mechanosensitive ion channel [Candidatus Omnitrophica bacterium]|nr:mechanosensitive ion channel [Candidatus Omnitrophota bacterium]